MTDSSGESKNFCDQRSLFGQVEGGEDDETERSINEFSVLSVDSSCFGTIEYEGEFITWKKGVFERIVKGVGRQECKRAPGGSRGFYFSGTIPKIMRTIAEGFLDRNIKIFWGTKEVPDGDDCWNEAEWNLVVRCETSSTSIARVYIWIRSWCGHSEANDYNSGCSIVWDTCPWNFWKRGLDERMRSRILEKDRIRLAMVHFAKKAPIVVALQRSFRSKRT